MIPLAWLSRIFASVAPIKVNGGNAEQFSIVVQSILNASMMLSLGSENQDI